MAKLIFAQPKGGPHTFCTRHWPKPLRPHSCNQLQHMQKTMNSSEITNLQTVLNEQKTWTWNYETITFNQLLLVQEMVVVVVAFSSLARILENVQPSIPRMMHTNPTLYIRINPVTRRAEMTVAECSLTSCMWACFRIGSHTMPGQRRSTHSDFVGSRVYACSDVTCQLHFWQNDGVLYVPLP